jgi:hypothetical protein
MISELLSLGITVICDQNTAYDLRTLSKCRLDKGSYDATLIGNTWWCDEYKLPHNMQDKLNEVYTKRDAIFMTVEDRIKKLISKGIRRFSDSTATYDLTTRFKEPVTPKQSDVSKVDDQWVSTKITLDKEDATNLSVVYNNQLELFSVFNPHVFFEKMLPGRPYMIKAYCKYLNQCGHTYEGYQSLYRLLELMCVSSVTVIKDGKRTRYNLLLLIKEGSSDSRFEPIWCDGQWVNPNGDLLSPLTTKDLDILFFKHPIAWGD